jgi:hypothetical protein
VLVGVSLLVWTATGIGAPQQERGSTAKQAKSATTETDGDPTSITTGSGKQFKTTVDRKTEGELSAEDFRQVSLLASRVVMHMSDAAKHLLDEKTKDCQADLSNALTLIGVIRDMLPTTTVTTVVEDASGKEVYRHVDRVQEDRIPLHEELIAVNVLEPITEAKQEAAELAGVRLADADVLHTSVLLELDYMERKLNRALKLIEKAEGIEDALVQLRLAQTDGVSYVVNRKDNPLVDAQMALQFAERMVEQGRDRAAQANLQLAKNQLELYRGLIGKAENEAVRKLQDEISKLQTEIGREDAAKTIRGFWDQVTGWFGRQEGETRATEQVADTPRSDKADTVKK